MNTTSSPLSVPIWLWSKSARPYVTLALFKSSLGI
ncbi:predicted protein [Plenodomus lingam JN3]|uniref:Predicted protein n=1 Tax=Leptosphaeria maculans (strain JN3 / isolate v23.1.3 / race Av1-4-5-6-7-8) TaxID=985895 RepID=E5AAY2_LEPMJ|nr:predicted protein [Plenodomus lingam JN3]CBY00823.1 predicted protein [Plenodomus lingam JN3]